MILSYTKATVLHVQQLHNNAGHLRCLKQLIAWWSSCTCWDTSGTLRDEYQNASNVYKQCSTTQATSTTWNCQGHLPIWRAILWCYGTFHPSLQRAISKSWLWLVSSATGLNRPRVNGYRILGSSTSHWKCLSTRSIIKSSQWPMSKLGKSSNFVSLWKSTSWVYITRLYHLRENGQIVLAPYHHQINRTDVWTIIINCPVNIADKLYYNLTENCNYGDLKDEMINDCLVVGIHDMSLLEKLQLDLKLTLKTVKTAIWQKEAVLEQQQALSGVENWACPVVSVDVIRNKRPKVCGYLSYRN